MDIGIERRMGDAGGTQVGMEGCRSWWEKGFGDGGGDGGMQEGMTEGCGGWRDG